MNIIAPTTDAREPIRPIYGPNDPRWVELAAWFEVHASRLVDEDGSPTASMEDLMPVERAEWYARCVLGVHVSMFEVGVDLPTIPDVPAPAWSTSSDFRGMSTESEYPVMAFIREMGTNATIEQELTFNPDTGVVSWGKPYLSVWHGDSDELRFTDPEEAWKLLNMLRAGADALDAVLDGEATR